MKKTILSTIALLFALSLSATEKRDFLQTRYTEEDVRNCLVMDTGWVPYPAYGDRPSWENFSDVRRQKYIANGERYLNFTWPVIRATDYLDFTRKGDRQAMENPFNTRRAALHALVMAELMEGRGRFMDDLINGVFSFCEQTYWGYSAHFYMYKEDESPGHGDPTTILPDITNPIVDLGVGEIAADLAWIHYFFHEAFDRISPVINRRIERELTLKVMEPYYARMDYWWLTGWKRGNVNNWNPWCNSNILNVIMLMEKDPEKRVKGVYKSMVSVDLFYNIYPEDGACDEGPSYWGAAGAKAFEYLDLLARVTRNRINIFDQPLIRDIGSYIYRVYISQGQYFANFADAPGRMGQGGGNIYRYADRTGDETMKAFGAFFMHRNKFDEQNPTGPLARVMEDLFNLEGWQEIEPMEPLIGEYYFPDVEIAIARNRAGSNEGFYFAAKGGHNGEAHNHNDVGSCIVFYNGNPVIVDAGVGTYTAKTFSPNRYEIWTMQSTYHNLPLINGVPQNPGGRYMARNSRFKGNTSTVSFSTDIAGAYPPEARVERWVRSYVLQRNKGLLISDRFRLKENNGQTEIRFLSPLQCSVEKPGTIRMIGDGFSLSMSYKPGEYTASIESKEMDDPRLKSIWGDDLTVIVLKAARRNSGNYTIELKSQ